MVRSCPNNTVGFDGFSGNLGINYLVLYECEFESETRWLAFALLVALVALCFYVLGSTADDHFSPALANICERLRLSPELAGVTLLAFGNGSPDVFSSLASFTGGADSPELGLAALLGAGMFLLTVVLGSVLRAAPGTRVAPASFSRDAVMFIVTISWILAWSLSGRDTTLVVALSYVALYAVYVALVFSQDWYERREAQRKARRTRASSLEQELGAPGTVEAFWGESAGAEVGTGAGASAEAEPVRHEQGVLRQPLLHVPRQESIVGVVGDAGGPDDAAHAAESARIADMIRRSPDIIDDYHADHVLSEEVASSSPGETAEQSRRRASSGMSTYFWKKQSWHARARAHAAVRLREFRTLPLLEAASLVACAPLDLARRATIPSLAPEQWFKPLAVVQPVLCAAFLLFVSGAAGRTRAAALLVMALSALASVGMQLVLHKSRPPQGVVAGVALALAFACSVGWIFCAANELVALLNTLGHIVGANPSILGLTVLAMGNSAGDLAANTAIARAGMPTMAIAACFGAPLLNILLGLGLSMTILVVSKAPEPVRVQLDRHSVATAACLLGTLSIIMLAATANRFQMPLWLPNALLLVYAAYIALSIALLWAGESAP